MKPKLATNGERFSGVNLGRKIKAKRERDPGFVDVSDLKPGDPVPRGDVDGGCPWLHGEARNRMFCGAPKIPGESWCAHHFHRCHNPPSRPDPGFIPHAPEVLARNADAILRAINKSAPAPKRQPRPRHVQTDYGDTVRFVMRP